MSNVADELKKLVTTHMEEAWRAGERGEAHIYDFKELASLIHRTQLESRLDELKRLDPVHEWMHTPEGRQMTIGSRIVDLQAALEKQA